MNRIKRWGDEEIVEKKNEPGFKAYLAKVKR
jgi:hypothetical protein